MKLKKLLGATALAGAMMLGTNTTYAANNNTLVYGPTITQNGVATRLVETETRPLLISPGEELTYTPGFAQVSGQKKEVQYFQNGLRDNQYQTFLNTIKDGIITYDEAKNLQGIDHIGIGYKNAKGEWEASTLPKLDIRVAKEVTPRITTRSYDTMLQETAVKTTTEEIKNDNYMSFDEWINKLPTTSANKQQVTQTYNPTETITINSDNIYQFLNQAPKLQEDKNAWNTYQTEPIFEEAPRELLEQVRIEREKLIAEREGTKNWNATYQLRAQDLEPTPITLDGMKDIDPRIGTKIEAEYGIIKTPTQLAFNPANKIQNVVRELKETWITYSPNEINQFPEATIIHYSTTNLLGNEQPEPTYSLWEESTQKTTLHPNTALSIGSTTKGIEFSRGGFHNAKKTYTSMSDDQLCQIILGENLSPDKEVTFETEPIGKHQISTTLNIKLSKEAANNCREKIANNKSSMDMAQSQ